MFDLHEALRYVVRQEGSDLHLKVPSRPLARIHGHLRPIEEYEPMQAQDTERVVREMLTDPEKLAEFDRENEVDFAYAVEGLARFRVNAFHQRGVISVAMRVIPFSVRTADELGLPHVISDIADEERGLILLTGTTGSGKSTTLAAMIDQINSTKSRHIVTIEDPIEYLHTDRTSIINQREVGWDTESFKRAMRRVLRQDRDMIIDPDQTGRLREVISEGEYYGMQTFDQALLRHYQAGRVSMEDALRVASSPHDFKLLVAAEGRTSTSMDDLVDPEVAPAAA